MKIRIYLLILSFTLFASSYAEEKMPAFMEKMSKEELDKWNELSIKLDLTSNNKEFEKALSICAEILKVDTLEGQMAYAKTYRMMGKDNEAIAWAEKAIEIATKQNSSKEAPMLLIASCYALMGNDDKANETLDEIIKLYPERPLAYKFYAEYYEQIGDTKNALHYWQEALKRFTDERAIEQAKERIAALEKSK